MESKALALDGAWGVKFESILRFIFHPIFVPTLEIRFFQKIGFL
jgi:hypothetical protein